MKSKIKKALRNIYGSFDSLLEHEYENFVTTILLNDNWERKEEWATYNQVILELKHTLKDELKVKELQYWLTDKTEPRIICIEVIKNVKDRTPELQRLYDKILNFN